MIPSYTMYAGFTCYSFANIFACEVLTLHDKLDLLPYFKVVSKCEMQKNW